MKNNCADSTITFITAYTTNGTFHDDGNRSAAMRRMRMSALFATALRGFDPEKPTSSTETLPVSASDNA
jgi:hypothetical protein